VSTTKWYYYDTETKKRIRKKYSELTQREKEIAQSNIRKWKQNNPERILLGNCRSRAKKLKLPFNLTIEDIVIPEICPVLGIPLQKGTGNHSANSPSIDRIIPFLGYIKGNVIIVSYKANTMKSNGTLDELQKVAEFYTNVIGVQGETAQVRNPGRDYLLPT